MNRNLLLVIKREYMERVSRKSFIITTILMPLIMAALMFAPALVMVMSGPESKTIAVIDSSEVIAPTLQNTDEIVFSSLPRSISVDSIKKIDSYDAILVIGNNVVDDPSNVQLYTHSAPSMQTEQFITSQLNSAIEEQRIEKFEIENLAQIMASVKSDAKISTYRIDKETQEETSSVVSYLIGIVMSMILYMFIIIYGQMVMTSIIEEKNNRVLEIVVSSVEPKALMLGKLLGVGLVALTQIVIWGVLIGCLSYWVSPLLSTAASADADLLVAVNQLGDTAAIFKLFGFLALFLICGYLLYSSMYAAIGSSVDNVQDASQLSTIAIAPIIIGMIFSMSVVNDPNSSFAFWFSMIPLTSPMVMMARIPFGIPAWQIWVSLAILVLSFLGMIWVSAKIYRIGIFMYGKKPTFKDLVRWARYK